PSQHPSQPQEGQVRHAWNQAQRPAQPRDDPERTRLAEELRADLRAQRAVVPLRGHARDHEPRRHRDAQRGNL
ncbi:TPR repeat, partial [Stigmatella aurantiaca DW4/3-1]